MSNIYLKVAFEKKRPTQNFDFPGQFLGSSNSRRYHWIFKLFVATWKSEVWGQNCVWLFYPFYYERNYDVLKSKSQCCLLNKNINFNKNETGSIMENPTHTFKDTHRQIKLQLLQRLGIWALSHWYIKSTLYKRFLNWNAIFKTIK